MLDILRNGDILSNPWPLPAGREDCKLRPDLRVGVISTLGCPQPEVDGFASAENRLCEEWWSEGDSEFLHNWHGQVPIYRDMAVTSWYYARSGRTGFTLLEGVKQAGCSGRAARYPDARQGDRTTC